MSNASSRELVPGTIGKPNIITRGLMATRPSPKEPCPDWIQALVAAYGRYLGRPDEWRGRRAAASRPSADRRGPPYVLRGGPSTATAGPAAPAIQRPITSQSTPNSSRLCTDATTRCSCGVQSPGSKSIEVRNCCAARADPGEPGRVPPNDPVFRGVPHNIGMSVSIDADPEHLGPGRDAVGWSGDGAPGAGTIRDFLEGAITQHFTRTLAARGRAIDFRLPTAREKRAVEAFMLSLGRQDEFDLEAMSFADADADAGRRLFLGEDGANRACSFCHDNAGANQEDTGLNENFDTGTHGLDPSLPPDDGFGNPGDGTFNTVSLVEAADTPPFFHNNSAATLEDAVGFYTTDIFGNSPVQAALAARSTSRRFRSSRWQRSCAPSMRSTTPGTRWRSPTMLGACETTRMLSRSCWRSRRTSRTGSKCSRNRIWLQTQSPNSRLRWT